VLASTYVTEPSARYRMLRRLGAGGMAEVFEAELAGELGFSRKVAIKRMSRQAAADREMATRFLDEARIASRLHHANIVSVVDMGLLDDLPFQVLELVDGVDVQQLQRRAGGVLPIEIALIIVGDVAHALDHAHEMRDASGVPLGIVHRDVKPSNVLVSWGGDVKLTDFGIAFANEREVKTEAGLVPGTMGFIAPEQRLKGSVDGRTDVFALGLTLHAMLTGYTPLRDVSVDIDLLAGKPIPLDAALPAEIRDAIARAVTPDKRDRLTAAQLAEVLGGLLAQRLTREPRGYLRSYLEPLRNDQPKAGALDQLLGFDVVLAAEPTSGEPRRYTLRASAPTVLAIPNPRNLESPTRRRVPRALFAAIGVVFAGGIAVWQLLPGSGGAARSHLDAGAVAMAPPDAAVTQSPAPIDATIATESPDAGSHAVAHKRREPTPTTTTTKATTQAAPPPTSGTGFFQVIGEANIGARILVDGREVGYAPNKIEVARGHHRLEVVRKDGTTAADEIDITDYHTMQKPLRSTL